MKHSLFIFVISICFAESLNLQMENFTISPNPTFKTHYDQTIRKTPSMNVEISMHNTQNFNGLEIINSYSSPGIGNFRNYYVYQFEHFTGFISNVMFSYDFEYIEGDSLVTLGSVIFIKNTNCFYPSSYGSLNENRTVTIDAKKFSFAGHLNPPDCPDNILKSSEIRTLKFGFMIGNGCDTSSCSEKNKFKIENFQVKVNGTFVCPKPVEYKNYLSQTLREEFSFRFEAESVQLEKKVMGTVMKKNDICDKWKIDADIYYLDDDDKFYYKYNRVSGRSSNENATICLDSENVPPMNLILPEILSALELPQNEDFPDDRINSCKGNKWNVSFSGLPYVVCQENNKIVNIYGEYFTASITNFYFGNLTEKLQIDYELEEVLGDCPESNVPLMQPEPFWWNRNEIDDVYDCIFLHGVGVEKTESFKFDKWEQYWPKVHEYTPQCKNRIFVRENTRDRSWDDMELQKSYCNAILYNIDEMSPSKEIIAKNKLIFAHSMGNLILAGAIKNKLCELDKSSYWYQIQGPFSGSKAADVIVNLCNGSDTFIRRRLTDFGYCKNETGTRGGYLGLTTNKNFDELKQIAKKHIKGSLCGTSPFGIFVFDRLLDTVALFTIDKIVNFDEENDGVVSFSSCDVGKFKHWSDDWRDDFYRAAANHDDGRCSGNGWWGCHRKPCSWYTSRTGHNSFNSFAKKFSFSFISIIIINVFYLLFS